jgi:hypothetical protein
MKVLVCGSRKCVVQAPIERELRKLPPGTIIIHGAARGVDNIAGYVGKRLGFPIRPYPADWDRYQKAAGAIRNTQMLEEEHPDPDGVYIDRVLAFHEDPNLGKGTRDMVAKAKKANPSIQVEIHLL